MNFFGSLTCSKRSTKQHTQYFNYHRASTSFSDYIELKGEQGAREAGKLRLEGKEYVVQDGDVMHFRFNV